MSSNVPSVRITKSARAAFSLGRPLRRQPLARGLVAQSALAQPRELRLRRTGGRRSTRSKSLLGAGLVQQRHVDDGERGRRSVRTPRSPPRSRDRPPDARSPPACALSRSRERRSAPSFVRSTRAVGSEHVGAEASPRSPRSPRCRRAVTPCASVVGVETRHAARGGTGRARSSCRCAMPPVSATCSMRRRGTDAPVDGSSPRRDSCTVRRPPTCPTCLPALPRELRRSERVLQQHRDRQRADAAGHRRQRAGDVARPPDARRRPRASRAARTPSRRFEPGGNSRSTIARSVTCVVPTSITVAPGLTNSGVTNAGRPIAATRMSASRATAADRPSANGRSSPSRGGAAAAAPSACRRCRCGR